MRGTSLTIGNLKWFVNNAKKGKEDRKQETDCHKTLVRFVQRVGVGYLITNRVRPNIDAKLKTSSKNAFSAGDRLAGTVSAEPSFYLIQDSQSHLTKHRWDRN